MSSVAPERAGVYLGAFDRAGEPGLFVNVLHKGDLALQWRCGFADLEAQVPWTDQTVAPVASHTKCMTAFVVMRLHETGILSADRAIGDVLEDLPRSWRALTLRQCLGNVGGLPYDEQIAWLLGRDWRTPTSGEWLQRITQKIPPRPPGEVFLYNDANFRLAVRVAERASGRTFEDLMQHFIFGPLAMTQSSFARHGERAARHKAGVYHCASDGFLRHLSYMELSGDGAALSTMHDLRKWAAFLLASAQTREQTLLDMCVPALLGDGRFANYGLGLSLGQHRGVSWFAHSGAGAGYSVVWCAPHADLAIIVLANRSDIDPTLVALNCADFWLGRDAPASARAAFSAHDAVRDGRLSGTFVDPENGTAATLERRGDVVRIDALGDYAFLRECADGVYQTEDGRLSCALDSKRMTLRADAGVSRLSPCSWKPMSAETRARIAGRYSEPNIDATLRVVSQGSVSRLLIADGPDTPWSLDLEECDAFGVFRAGVISGRVMDGVKLRLIVRGLPTLTYLGASRAT